MPTPIYLFISYARKDEALLGELVKHLELLQRQGLIRAWYDREIEAGVDWEAEVHSRLDAAQLVLLLVSADFIASPFCWDVEMKRAMARQAAGTARVIPILLRACDWKTAPFAELRALPEDEKPIQSWPDRDEAWTSVATRIRAAVGTLSAPLAQAPCYPDAETRRLAEDLTRARARLKALHEAGEDASDAQREVLELRRRLREGGQLRAGDRLEQGRYLLLERVGKGGFANVWRARDDEHDELVAIKVLHSSLADDATRRERFFRGAQRMAMLEHPAVVRVLSTHGEDEGFHYFVMEFVPGGDLQRAVLEKRVAPEEVVPLVLRVGEALSEAHTKGLVHRDVKPANILLDASGAPRLTDFDLVAAADTTGGTRTGALGTFLYSAPEVLHRPQDADARVDVYGLGMTALFCFYGAALPAEVVHDRHAFMRELSCHGTLKAVLEKAVAWKHDKRYASVDDFSAALRIASSLRRTWPPPHPAVMAGGVESPAAGEPAKPRIGRLQAKRDTAVDSLRRSAAIIRAVSDRDPLTPAEERVRTEEQVASALQEAVLSQLEMIIIPGARFSMGSREDEPLAQDDERPLRKVEIGLFRMSRTPVTQRLYCEVMGTNPSRPEGDDLPVTMVRWTDAIEFCNRLSKLKGLTPAYRIDKDNVTWLREANGYRLPTEAEWEYAARGIDARIYPWGNEPPLTQLCWSGARFSRELAPEVHRRHGPSPVGSYPKGASASGLLDMAGNVWEWCWDCYSRYTPTDRVVVDPVGPPAGGTRVLRGGSWKTGTATRLRAAARGDFVASVCSEEVGFRCARGGKHEAGAPPAPVSQPKR